MFELFVILLCSLVVSYIGFIAKVRKPEQKDSIVNIPSPVVNIDLTPLHKDIQELPNKMLQSITNSSNTHKGALGELIGYIRLQAQYDRIIPIGSIVDFICIKLPTTKTTGKIDFVDVKTGKNARLSKEQRALRDLIKAKEINFVELKIKELSEAPSSKS